MVAGVSGDLDGVGSGTVPVGTGVGVSVTIAVDGTVGVVVGITVGVTVGVGVLVGSSAGDSVGVSTGVGSPVGVGSGEFGTSIGGGTVVRGEVVWTVVEALVTVPVRVVDVWVTGGPVVSSGGVSTGSGVVIPVIRVAVATGVTPVGRALVRTGATSRVPGPFVSGSLDRGTVWVGVGRAVPPVVRGMTVGTWAKGTVSGVHEEIGGSSEIGGVEWELEGSVVVGGEVERTVAVPVVTVWMIAGTSSSASSPGVGTGGTVQSAPTGADSEVVLVVRATPVPVAFPVEGRMVSTANGRAGETNATAKSTMQVTTPNVIRVLMVYSSCI